MTYNTEAVERLIAERDANRDEALMYASKLGEAERERDALKAELAEARDQSQRNAIRASAAKLQGASDSFEELRTQLTELREAAEDVVAWDWSDNDADCVRDMEKLRGVLAKVKP